MVARTDNFYEDDLPQTWQIFLHSRSCLPSALCDMETNYNSNRVHIFALILSQLTSNYQCDLDPALIQISRLKIKIRIKTVNIWKVWRILLPTVVYDWSTIDGNLPNISEGTIWSRSDNYRLSATQSDTIYWFEVFLKPFAKFSNCCLIVLLK